MEEIGVRELKAKLSAVLRMVEHGESVRVTSRGRVVAEIVPPRALSTEQRLAELEAAGRITLAKEPWPDEPPPLEHWPEGPLPSEIIIAEREDRF